MFRPVTLGAAGTATLLLLCTTAFAADPAAICESSQIKATSKYSSCLLTADSKAAKSGGTPDYSKCNLDKVTAAADKAGPGVCPGTVDPAALKAYVDQCAAGVSTALAGGDLPSGGGSGGSGGLLKTGQTACYEYDDFGGSEVNCAGTGHDGESQKGLARSYTDNGDGTITDNVTGLIWEKLDDNDANGIHDYSSPRPWLDAFKKIQVLNGDASGCIAANNPDTCCTGAGTGSCSAFTGHTDWRLPNVFELSSLQDYGRVYPAIDPAFHTNCQPGCTDCSCTKNGKYWSSTTPMESIGNVWLVDFAFGGLNNLWEGGDDGDGEYYGQVRAVRGGS